LVAEMKELKASADPQVSICQRPTGKGDNLHQCIFYKLQLDLEADFKFELLPLHFPVKFINAYPTLNPSIVKVWICDEIYLLAVV
jgi:hypothetical protein